jgi:hypothetical protein
MKNMSLLNMLVHSITKQKTFYSMKISLVLFIVIDFILGSCSTTELSTSEVKPSEVVDLQYFEPFSYVSGNKKMLNDSLSSVSKQLLNEVVLEFKDKISLTGAILVTNNAIKQRLEKEIENLIVSANDIKLLSLSSIRITPLIDSLLESNNKRFGLITSERGYVSTHDAIQKGEQIAASVIIGVSLLILAHGNFNPFLFPQSDKSYSDLYIMIVDADQDNIAFYRKSFRYGDPTDKNVLTYQFKKIFKDYYFAKN